MRRYHLRRRSGAMLAALLLGAAAITQVAGVATPGDPADPDPRSYERVEQECGSNGSGSGARDGRGLLYVACSSLDGTARQHIRVHDAIGVRRGTIDVTAGTGTVSDVAPSPDGRFLYVARGQVIQRMVRQADGSYLSDPAWSLAPIQMYGTTYPALARHVATDAAGNIYLAAGMWASGLSTVVRYTPDGTFVTRFGEWNKSWAAGDHYTLSGIDVTRNGDQVWVTEVHNSRLQRWDRQPDGSYRSGLLVGNTEGDDPTRAGICGRPAKFAAPYDLAIGNQGHLYVTNTTCLTADANPSPEVQRLAADGSWIETVQMPAFADKRVHGIAVDAAGGIYLGQGNLLLRPAVDATDVAAPRVDSLSVTAVDAPGTVNVDVTAVDDRKVRYMRVASDGQSLDAQPWLVFAASSEHVLPPGAGTREVRVEVRDAAGNVSAVARVTVDLGPVNAAPRIDTATVPSPARSRLVRVTTEASDDDRVARIRTANENGLWTPWRSYAASVDHTLSNTAAFKVVFVQVDDLQGATSPNRALVTYCPTCVVNPGSFSTRPQRIAGSGAADRIVLGNGTQHVNLSHPDGIIDRVNCGAGIDTVLKQPEDVATDCERVAVVRSPGGGA